MRKMIARLLLAFSVDRVINLTFNIEVCQCENVKIASEQRYEYVQIPNNF